jgi:hypothetical protein
MARRIVELSLSQRFCPSAVQRALQLVELALPGSEQKAFVLELAGNVGELLASAPGCAVLQAILERMPIAFSLFIIPKLSGRAVDIAQDEEGHRLLCKMLALLPQKQTRCLVQELLSSVAMLSCHIYGNRVIQYIVRFGSMRQKNHVCKVIAVNEAILCEHQNACAVVRMVKRYEQSLHYELACAVVNSDGTPET